eukprot:gnl/MRDRNA2_/MRDRNA2_57602_c0_seq3.p1 gnl/MRDRNA2_/MRDRNA2_57602_c0~~gnl/MRDRNA2_/MRDRNA2_57602_c0_seq3.p1  ORF type:complete len:163 (+),score=20.57 gnl/MRDRNA2_/MRDRNA2_57602_c0_seq3:126-614(+)
MVQQKPAAHAMATLNPEQGQKSIGSSSRNESLAAPIFNATVHAHSNLNLKTGILSDETQKVSSLLATRPEPNKPESEMPNRIEGHVGKNYSHKVGAIIIMIPIIAILLMCCNAYLIAHRQGSEHQISETDDNQPSTGLEEKGKVIEVEKHDDHHELTAPITS